MPRTISTNTTVDRDALLQFLRPRRHVVLMTTRADGSPQVSPVTAGIDNDGRVVVASFPLARLIDVKNTYDPTNLFRMNQNIQPTL
jgi:hypothetical protein